MKRTFKQLLKKTVLAVTATSMLVSALPAVGFAATAADPVVWNYDYNSSGSHFGTNATPPVEHSGNAQKFDKHSTATANDQWGSSYMQGPAFAETGSGETAANSNTSTDPYVVSFDFMLTSTAQNYKFMLRDWPGNTPKTDEEGNITGYNKQTNDFAFVNFVDGHIYLDKAASGKSVLDPNFADTMYDAGAYTPNKWYNISMYVTPGEAGTTTIGYYIDGAYVYGADSSVRTKSNGILFTSYLGVLTTKDAEGNYVAPTTGEFWIDNFMMQYASGTYYTNLTYSEPVVDGQNISVDFIEPVRTDGYSMSDIKLYNSNNTEVTGATAAVSGKTLKITGAALTNGKYYIALPAAFKGVSGVNPESDVIEVLVEQKKADNVTWISELDYTSGFGGFIAIDSNVTTVSTDNDTNKAIQFVSKGSGGGWDAAVSDLKPAIVSSENILDKNYNLSDELVFSEDYYFPSTTGNITGSGLIRRVLEGANIQFVRYQFYNNNTLVLRSNTTGSWADAYTITVKPNTWYTVKTVVNKPNKTVDYYLTERGSAETYIGTTAFSVDWNDASASRIRTVYSDLNGSTYDPGKYYVDNTKFGYIVDTEYKKVIDEHAEVITSAYKISDSTSIRTDKSYMISFDVTPASLSDVQFSVNGDGTDKNFLFKILSDGTLKTSKSMLNWWSVDYEETLSGVTVEKDKPFNVKLYVDKDVISIYNGGTTARRSAFLYINGKNVKSFALGWGAEHGAAPSGFTQFIGVTGSANAKISNFKLGYTSKIPYVDSAVIYNKNEAVGHSFVSQNTKSDIEKIVLNVADTSYASSGTLTAGTAKLTKGTDTIELDAAVSGSQVVLTTKNGAYVPNGEWTLNYTGSADCGDYIATFTVNDTRDMVDNSSFTFDAGTKTATLSGSIQNFKEEKTVVVIIAEYSSDTPQSLANVSTYSVKLSTGNNTLSGLTLSGESADSANYKAFIWNSVPGMVPIVSAKTVQ